MGDNIQYDFFHKQTGHHLVQKYFSLRAKSFIDQWGLKHFSGSEDKYDKDAYIIVAHKDGQCYGGSRLIVHEVDSDTILPMETDDFRLTNLLPQLELNKHKYAEISRVALTKELRNGQHSAEMYRRMLAVKARQLGITYAFCVTTMELARSSRISCKNVGLHLEIHPEISVPDLETYEQNKMQLSIIDLQRTTQPKKSLIQAC